MTIAFFGSWAIRSAALIVCGELIVRAIRVKDPAIRLAACQAMLAASLAIPVLTSVAALHSLPIAPLPGSIAIPAGFDGPSALSRLASGAPAHSQGLPFDWAAAAGVAYLAVSLFLLLRLAIGAALSLRVLSGSRSTGRSYGGADIRESDRTVAPVTLGILRPKIVLPGDWQQWSESTLQAVLAHEGSHIRRFDPALQFLSAVHRAILWVSPLSWYLHRKIVSLGETVSDDAALAGAPSRTFYAELLLDFMRRNADGEPATGIPMARYGPPDERIHRILNGAALSRRLSRRAMAAILVCAAPLEYVIVAAHAFTPSPAGAQTNTAPSQFRNQASPQPLAPARAQSTKSAGAGIPALGSVAASSTIVVRPRVEGQLLSIAAREGELVHAGQLLATLDARQNEIAAEQADAQLAADLAQLRNAQNRREMALEMAPRIASDQAKAESAHLLVGYAKIYAPGEGMIGLRQVDAGNFVHPDQPMFVITQLRPIAVRFRVPEDYVGEVRAGLGKGEAPTVEAWNRENTKRLATGRLTATNNQIDTQTGTIELKAEFENRDGALFPNQFVNVHLFLDSR